MRILFRRLFLCGLLSALLGCAGAATTPPIPTIQPASNCSRFDKSWLPDALDLVDADQRMSEVLVGCSADHVALSAIIRADLTNASSRYRIWLSAHQAKFVDGVWVVADGRVSFRVRFTEFGQVAGTNQPNAVEYRYGAYRGAFGDGLGLAEIYIYG